MLFIQICCTFFHQVGLQLPPFASQLVNSRCKNFLEITTRVYDFRRVYVRNPRRKHGKHEFTTPKERSISTGDSTAAELRLALTISLSLTYTGFAVLTLLKGYRRRFPDPNASVQIESPVLIECRVLYVQQ